MLRKFAAQWYFVPVLLVVVFGFCLAIMPDFRDSILRLGAKATGNEYVQPKQKSDDGPADLVFDAKRNPIGLRLSDEAMKGLKPTPVTAIDPNKEQPKKQRPLPPQFGTINYDNERMFIIRSRFPGEVAEIPPPKWMRDLDPNSSIAANLIRPLRVGDKVEQNELLAVVWSQPLGQAKSALIDAICSLALSSKQYELKQEAFKEAALSLASLMGQERQVQADMLTRMSAERSLWMWKLTKDDIKEIEHEAQELRKLMTLDKLKKIDPEKLAHKWARVEIRAPIFKMDPNDPTKPDPKVQLTIVEKNFNLNEMLDPIASVPMYKLAYLGRLTLMVQPHEEYYPILRDQLDEKTLNWKIQVQAYPHEKPLEPPIEQVLPSLDPGLRTCIVTGYLDNPDGAKHPGQSNFRYLVGQFCTATIFVDPEDNTVDIPTNALLESEGESLVFVQDAKKKDTFYAKRSPSPSVSRSSPAFVPS